MGTNKNRAAWCARRMIIVVIVGVAMVGLSEQAAHAQGATITCADVLLPGVNAADVCGDAEVQITLQDEVTFVDPNHPLVDGTATLRDRFGLPLARFDVAGSAAFVGVRPGSYLLETSAPGHQTSQVTFEAVAPSVAVNTVLERSLVTTAAEEIVSGAVPDTYDIELVSRDGAGVPIVTWEQELTVARPWFAYEFAIDASTLAQLPTGMSIDWSVDGAAYDITLETAGLTTESGGTWSMDGPQASLVANFTATSALPIDEATPTFISGTLSFEVDGSESAVELPPRPVILQPVPELGLEYRNDSTVAANEPFSNQVVITNQGAAANVDLAWSAPQAGFPISVASSTLNGTPTASTTETGEFNVAPSSTSLVVWNMASDHDYGAWDQTILLTRRSADFSDDLLTVTQPAGSNECSIKWASGSNGEWSEPTNWITPSGLVRAPGASDTVCILADVGDVTVTTNDIGSLLINTLINEQTLVLRSDMTAAMVYNRGTISWVRRQSELIADVMNEPEGILTVDGGETLDLGGGSIVENYGLIDVQSGVAFGFRIGNPNVGGASVTNRAGGTIRLSGGTSVNGATLINEPGAVIETSGTGRAMLQVTLENFEERGGTIRTVAGTDFLMRSCGICTRSFTNTRFDIATGSEFRTESAIGGEHQIAGVLQPDANATGTGGVHFSDTFYANGSVTVDFPHDGQRFIFDGTNPHTVDVMGDVMIPAGSVAHLEGTGASGMNMLEGATFTNHGTFRILENGDLYGQGEFENFGRFEVDLVPAIDADERAEIGRNSDLVFRSVSGVIAAVRGDLRFDAAASFDRTTFEAAATQNILSSDSTIVNVVSGAGQGTVRFNRDIEGALNAVLDFPASGPDLILDGTNPNTINLTGVLTAPPDTVTHLRGSGASGMVIEDGAAFINQGTFRLLENSDLYGEGRFVNLGTFETAYEGVAAAAVADVGRNGDLRFEDDGGLIDMDNGAIDFDADLVLDGTSLVVPAGATMTSRDTTTFAGTVRSASGGGVFRIAGQIVGDTGIIDFVESATELIVLSGTKQSGDLANAGVLSIQGTYEFVGSAELENEGELLLSGTTIGGPGVLRNLANGVLRAVDRDVRIGVDTATIFDELGGVLSAPASFDMRIEDSAQTSMTDTRFEVGADAIIRVEANDADVFAGVFGTGGSAAGGQVVFAHFGGAAADPVVALDFPGSDEPGDGFTDVAIQAASGDPALAGVWQVNTATTLVCDGGCAPGPGSTLRVLGALELDDTLAIQGGTLELVGAAKVDGGDDQRDRLIVAGGALSKQGAGIASVTQVRLDALTTPASSVRVLDGSLMLRPAGGEIVPVDGDWRLTSTATVHIEGDGSLPASLILTSEISDAAFGVVLLDGQAALAVPGGPTVSVTELNGGASQDRYELVVAAGGFSSGTAAVGGTLPTNRALSVDAAGATGAGPSVDLVKPGPDEGEPCDDGDAATDSDVVVDGVCVGVPVDCDDGVGWTVDAFDGVGCVSVPLEGAACDDGDAATVSDTVTSGVCVGTPVVCDDGLAWTEDIVDDELGCQHEFEFGAECDDLDPATVDDEVTEAGDCVGVEVDCDDGVGWTVDAFDGVGCVSVPLDGAACDDGDAATDPDVVVDGVCVGVPVDCDDGVAWTVDSFDGVACVSVPDEGAACDDGLPGTVGDVVTGGACVGTATDCDDGIAWTIDSYEDGLGCTSEPDEGSACDDGLPGTVDDVVSSGVCAGIAVDCDDGLAWTVNTFDGVECVATPIAFAVCDDGDPATENDLVLAGDCIGSPIVCDDGIAWTIDSFDGEECVSLPDEGAACSDGSPATTNGSVVNGECVGDPVECPDPPENSVVVLDPVLGCTFEFDVGAPCDDGNASTHNDTLTAEGECTGTPDQCSGNGAFVAEGCVCDHQSDGFWSGDDCSLFISTLSPPAPQLVILSQFIAPPPPAPVTVVYTATCVSDTQVVVQIEELDTETLSNVAAVVTNGSPSTTTHVAPGAPIVVTLLLSSDTEVTLDGPDVAPQCAMS